MKYFILFFRLLQKRMFWHYFNILFCSIDFRLCHLWIKYQTHLTIIFHSLVVQLLSLADLIVAYLILRIKGCLHLVLNLSQHLHWLMHFPLVRVTQDLYLRLELPQLLFQHYCWWTKIKFKGDMSFALICVRYKGSGKNWRQVVRN